jgi:hypothetical protein
VVQDYGKGRIGKVRMSKDVVFDDYENYLERTALDYPHDPEYLPDQPDPELEPEPIPEPIPEPAAVADVPPLPPLFPPPPREYPVPIAQERYGPWGPDFNYPAVLHRGHEPDAV